MRDGLKRCIQYVTLFQAKMMMQFLIFGCVYGVVMGFLMEDSYMTVLQAGIQFFNLFLFIAVLSTQLNFMRTMVHFILSLNCTRKDLIAGHRVMSIEMIAEVMMILLLLNSMPGAGGDSAPAVYRPTIYLFLLLMATAMGILAGIVPPEYGLLGRIVLVIILCMVGGVAGAVTIGPDWTDMMAFASALLHGDENLPVVLGAVAAAVAVAFTFLSQILVARRIKKLEVRL